MSLSNKSNNIKIMKRILAIAVLAAVSHLIAAQASPDKNVPADPAYRIGKLENGLTYYIRHNTEPAGRASYYIIQNVGAILEQDDQNGLAHFLEHMAFNGTTHFPGKTLLSTLEKHGVAFGRNINAYTHQAFFALVHYGYTGKIIRNPIAVF